MTSDIVFLIRTENLQGKALATLRRELSNLIAPGRRLVIDLSHVHMVDSVAVNGLLEVAGRLQDAGGQLKLTGLNKRVAAFFELLRANRFVETVMTPAGAPAMAMAA